MTETSRRLFEHANRSIEFLGLVTGLPVRLLTPDEYQQIERQTAQLTDETEIRR